MGCELEDLLVRVDKAASALALLQSTCRSCLLCALSPWRWMVPI